MIIKQPNPSTQGLTKTYLSTTTSAGTAFPVKNIAGFSPSWAIQLGETGEEQAEILILGTATPSGTALNTVGTSLFSHSTDTPVYPIKFDKVIFEVSTVGTSGTAAALTNGTVSLQADSIYTQFDDTSGSASYAYKTKFFNSVSLQESEESDWILPAGPSQYSLYKMRQRVRDKLFNSGVVEDYQINDWINEWKDEMTNTAIKVNKDYACGTTQVVFNANQESGTITNSDFKTIRRIWWVSGGGTYPMQRIDQIDYRPEEIFTETRPAFYYQGDNTIGHRPFDVAGTCQIVYYKLNTNLENDLDELPVPMRGYSKSFVDYALYNALMKDKQEANADRYHTSAETAKQNFLNEITPRHENSPEYVKTVDPISDDESYFYL